MSDPTSLRGTLESLLYLEISRAHHSRVSVDRSVGLLMDLVDVLVDQGKAEVLREALYRLRKVEPGSVFVALENMRDEVFT